MLHSYSAQFENVLLRPLREEDIESLRIWRNNPAKTAFLRPIGTVTPQMQRQWFDRCLENPDEITFAIEETESLHRLVGSLALYHFHGDTAEIGRIQIGDDEAHGRGVGRRSLALASWIGFRLLGLSRIISFVHPDNTAAWENNLNAGFLVVGSRPSPTGNGSEAKIEITPERLRQANPFLADASLRPEV